jgi:hypothetical protein
LSPEQLIALVEETIGGGITITFSGKANATRIARKVRPRVTRPNKSLSVGPEAAQAANLLIEGDNLQAMATLYRERGEVDLILADPPYNTGNDFWYNDRWEEDPNDPGMGDLVSADDGARHTKWMRFMWPRLQMMRSMLRPVASWQCALICESCSVLGGQGGAERPSPRWPWRRSAVTRVLRQRRRRTPRSREAPPQTHGASRD